MLKTFLIALKSGNIINSEVNVFIENIQKSNTSLSPVTKSQLAFENLLCGRYSEAHWAQIQLRYSSWLQWSNASKILY